MDTREGLAALRAELADVLNRGADTVTRVADPDQRAQLTQLLVDGQALLTRFDRAATVTDLLEQLAAA